MKKLERHFWKKAERVMRRILYELFYRELGSAEEAEKLMGVFNKELNRLLDTLEKAVAAVGSNYQREVDALFEDDIPFPVPIPQEGREQLKENICARILSELSRMEAQLPVLNNTNIAFFNIKKVCDNLEYTERHKDSIFNYRGQVKADCIRIAASAMRLLLYVT